MKPLDRTLLRPEQVTELQEEKTRIQSSLSDPEYRKTINAGEAKKAIGRINNMLTEQAPEPLSGVERDKLSKTEKDLREKWRVNMPPQEIMRRNPPGAVDWHNRWEKANKANITQWKNVKRQLEPDSNDPDLANVERYRPAGADGAMRTDSQIPGPMTYSGVPDKNWADVFGKTEPQPDAPVTAAMTVIVNKKTRKPMSDEQRQAAGARLAAARAAKKQLAEARHAEGQPEATVGLGENIG